MTRNYTCIICPMGCDMQAEIEHNTLASLEGNNCAKGRVYVLQELTNPMRNIATSVLVKGGDLPIVSVRLDRPIPKASIFRVMEATKNVVLAAPLSIGEMAVKNIADTGADLIVTKHIRKTEKG